MPSQQFSRLILEMYCLLVIVLFVKDHKLWDKEWRHKIPLWVTIRSVVETEITMTSPFHKVPGPADLQSPQEMQKDPYRLTHTGKRGRTYMGYSNQEMETGTRWKPWVRTRPCQVPSRDLWEWLSWEALEGIFLSPAVGSALTSTWSPAANWTLSSGLSEWRKEREEVGTLLCSTVLYHMGSSLVRITKGALCKDSCVSIQW